MAARPETKTQCAAIHQDLELLIDTAAAHPLQGMGAKCRTAEPLWDSQLAAHYLRIHPRTLTRLAQAGEIPAFRIGRHWRFRPSDLDAWTESKVSSSAKLNALSASTEKGDLA